MPCGPSRARMLIDRPATHRRTDARSRKHLLRDRCLTLSCADMSSSLSAFREREKSWHTPLNSSEIMLVSSNLCLRLFCCSHRLHIILLILDLHTIFLQTSSAESLVSRCVHGHYEQTLCFDFPSLEEHLRSQMSHFLPKTQEM